MTFMAETGGPAGRIRRVAPYMFLTLLVVILFADVLFVPGDKVPSALYGDVNHYFSTARAFGFREIGRGNFPLWDPYIFSGTPFVATFQSAMLYPPNLVYAVLPLSKAISFDLAVHVLLFGLFTFAWARSRSVSRVGCTFAGAAAMFSGAFFYRVAAGHVTVIDGCAWMPLILLAVDKLLQRPSLFWTMAGIFAVAMQILAGMPQVVFITCVTAGLLCVFQPMRWIKRPASLAALVSLGVFPVLLAAVQLFTSFQAMQYSKSHGGGSFEFSSAYSFPPVNLLTLLSPNAYGAHIFYWGRGNGWEVTFYIGIAGLFLAFYGIAYGPRRGHGPLPATAAILFLLALGHYTPAYRLVYQFIPGFSLFRAPARFLVPCSVVLAVFAGYGLEALWSGKGRPGRFAAPLLVLALLLVCGAFLAWRASRVGDLLDSTWHRIMEANFGDPIDEIELMRWAGVEFTRRLLTTAGLCVLLALLLAVADRVKVARALVVLLGLAELITFAATTRSSFRLSDGIDLEFQNAVPKLGDGRLFEDPFRLNLAYASGAKNIWGYEPMIQDRYVKFIGHAMHVKQPLTEAGRDPDFLKGAEFGPLLLILRMRAYSDGKTLYPVISDKPAMPVFALINSCSVVGQDQVLNTMDSAAFDPFRQVILEEPPVPAPDPNGKPGTVSILDASADHYVVEVNTPAPAILLNTDAYAPGWRVRPLAPGPQDAYCVLPADYVVRGIPLAAGHHRLRIEYAPSGFIVGMWVSLISVAGYLVVAAVYLWRRPAHGGAGGK